MISYVISLLGFFGRHYPVFKVFIHKPFYTDIEKPLIWNKYLPYSSFFQILQQLSIEMKRKLSKMLSLRIFYLEKIEVVRSFSLLITDLNLNFTFYSRLYAHGIYDFSLALLLSCVFVLLLNINVY